MDDRLAALEALRRCAVDPYPARCNRTHLVGELPSPGPILQSSSPVMLAGRVLALDGAGLLFEDPSGRIRISRPPAGGDRSSSGTEETVLRLDLSAARDRRVPMLLSPDEGWGLIDAGDVVQLELVPSETFVGASDEKTQLDATAGGDGGALARVHAAPTAVRADAGWRLRAIAVLAKAVRDPAAPNAQGEPVPGGGATPRTLARRAGLLQHLRRYFTELGFIEVETPIMALHAGLEPHLDPFVSTWRPEPTAPGTPVYLLTSPEYAMKRLLVAGMERVFQLSRVFRNGEVGPFHNPEFTMLEWYRAFASYEEIQTDLEGMVISLAAQQGLGMRLRWQGRAVDLTPPWPRLTVREAFLSRTGIDLAEAQDAASLRAAAQRNGIELPADESWEDSFFRLLVERVEPALGMDRPVFLTEYPAAFAALAKVRPGRLPVAERFELYVAGVEVGNAYTELNDPDAQRARFEEERVQRRAMGVPDLEPDPDYLAALERGLPPTGGIAVGVDRLVMLLLDLPDVRQTLAFPFPMAR